jgi:DNA polymerase-3 subunit gamma/tau
VLSELALYRKYRSNDFTEVVGQEHVVKTLTNAIASGRFSHAYLFTGPRGTGKTSVARLLARALNCTGEPKPCNKCANCLAAINSSLDVVEIDAASNRSIDSIRDLRDKVSLAPTQGKYKIYIIDEVHMLTTEAANALLKTLEEPPAHAIFVLATTEAHKIPETIISRTQRFTFKPGTTKDIAAQLASIATKEGLSIEPAALQVIAHASRGGFRDAISMLDQLSSSTDTPITEQTVRSLLGYSSSEEIQALAQAIAGYDAKAGLEVLSRLETSGGQPAQVATQLIELWRAVLLTAAGASAAPSKPVADLASSVPQARTAAVIEALLEVMRSHWPQLSLEATIVRLAVPGNAPTSPQVPSLAPVAKPAASNVQVTAPPVVQPVSVTQIDQTPAVAQDGGLTPALWPKVLVLLKAQNNSLCALLQMYPVDFGAQEVTIKPRFNFHRDLFLKPANRNMIETAASKVYGKSIKVSARTEETAKRAPKPDAGSELAATALEIFGGEIVD